MLTESFEQGSPEWFKARSGIPTASCFNKIITTKGAPTKGETRKKYIYQLAGERLLGDKAESFSNDWMKRGVELESEAREAYSFITGHEVIEVGLCYKDKKKSYSCSPDGLVDENGGLEIKCPSLPVHTEYLHKDKLPTTYFQQVQGTLFVTGREWWDFVSFFPGVKTLIKRVEPDKEFHKKLENALMDFCNELDKITEQLR